MRHLGRSKAALAIRLPLPFLLLLLLLWHHGDSHRCGISHKARKHILHCLRCLCHLFITIPRVMLHRYRGRTQLRLVEDLGHDQFSVLLLLVPEVVLVHHPVGLLRFPLFSIATVQHQDLLAPLLPPSHDHRTRLASLVPPRLANIFTAMRSTL